MSLTMTMPFVLQDRESRRWLASSVAAVGVYVGVVGAFLWDFSSQMVAPLEQPQAALTVQLATLPTSPPRPETHVTPGPDQVRQKVQPTPHPKRQFDPPPQTPDPPPPDALQTKQDPVQPEQKLSAEKTTATQANEAKPDDKLQAPVESSPSNASNVAETWESKLLAHLEHFKQYPDAAQHAHQEDVVYLRFTIDRTGKVLQWDIERSHRYALLDSAARDLIQRASPLPAPPDDVPGSTIAMVVPVEFFIHRAVARR